MPFCLEVAVPQLRNPLRNELDDEIPIEFDVVKYPSGVLIQKVEIHPDYGRTAICIDPADGLRPFLAGVDGDRIE